MAVSEKASLRLYGDAIKMWIAKFDTAAIAERIGVTENLVEVWVWNFRDMARPQ